ncbi:MAG: cytidine deaminase [Desulfurococcales archaeon]|nr:cytidine deaminase [Desulfurococcales archaeon]
MSEEELFGLARKLISYAYAPYSNFKVVAFAETRLGELFQGVNIENASYSLTICAERTAVFNAISNGHRDIERIHIFTETDEPVSPCGACRQVIAEFNPTATIISYSLSTGRKKQWTLKELLPDHFNLKI